MVLGGLLPVRYGYHPAVHRLEQYQGAQLLASEHASLGFGGLGCFSLLGHFADLRCRRFGDGPLRYPGRSGLGKAFPIMKSKTQLVDYC